MKICRVEFSLVTLPALSGMAHEEERYPLRARALQGGRAVAGLFKADTEAGGQLALNIVFRAKASAKKRSA